MSIALVNPAYDYPYMRRKGEQPLYNRIWQPLCLANIARLTDAKLIDANALRLSPGRVARKVRNYEKIFITSASYDRWQCPHFIVEPVLKFINKIKDMNPEAEVCLMGPHGSVRPGLFFMKSNVDVIIRGEPEKTVLELCNDKKENISGISFRKGKRVVHNKPRPWMKNLDILFPDFFQLPMKKYEYELLGKPFCILETSRGCPFQCIFCLKTMFGNSYRKKSIEHILEELSYVTKEFGIRYIYFMDLEFSLDQDRTRNLCRKMRKFNIKWTCQTRTDTISYETAKIMKEAGCELIHFGIESGSPRVLKILKKGEKIEQIEKGVKAGKRAGIKIAGYFTIGNLNETREDIFKTIEFAKKLPLDYASFHITIPYSGTEFHSVLEFNEDFPSGYYEIINKKDLEAMRKKAYNSFYYRPSFIFKQLKEFLIHPERIPKQIKVFSYYKG